MKQFLYTGFLLTLLSCNPKERPISQGNEKPVTVQDSIAVVNDPTVNLNIQMNSYNEIDSSAILLFPLSVSENEDRNGFSRSYKDMPNDEFWNIAFLNSKTNEYHLLSENKMLITGYQYNIKGYERAKVLNDKIFYTIRAVDFNKDKLYNENDPLYLFISDKKGNNFKQVSPSNYNFQEWTYIDSSNKIILKLQKDSDNNNLFDYKDETVIYDVNANFEKDATEVFSTEFKNKLKILFDRDWKRIKK